MRETNLNLSPYFDDYDVSKRFQQILFKAGETVQTRELMQMQDILMDQIESFGSNIFRNGSPVVRGDFTVQTRLKSIQYTLATGTLPTNVDTTLPVTIVGATSGVEATVTKFTPNGAFIEITKKGASGEVETFIGGEALNFVQDSNTIASAVETSQGLGSFARVEAGIYFIRGIFLRVDTQEIILSETDNVSAEVGLTVTEEIINSTIDNSLLSNASGTVNFRASGADRLRFTLTLAQQAVDAVNADFVRLALVNTGTIEDISSESEYSELERTLAQRTFEESGNYSVTPTEFEIREHLNDGTNGGVYTASEGGDTNKLVAVVEPSISYVRGFRNENDTERFVEFPKSRETTVANNSVTPAQYGSTVSLINCQGVPVLNNNVLYNLRNSGGDVIGTMRVFSSLKTGSNSYSLIARDINFTSSGWSSVTSITAVDGGANFSGTPRVQGILEGSSNTLIFPLPFSGVRTLEPSGTTDTTYTVTDDYVTTLNSEGVATISAPFGSQFIGTFTLFSVALADGSGGELSVNYTLVGTPLGSGIQIDAGTGNANASIRAVLVAAKNTSGSRTKTLTTAIDTITVTSTTREYLLTNVDGVSITALNIDGVDYANSFRLNSNQTDYSYERSSIEAIGAIPAGTLTVEYQYFQHGEGDYFSVDSYSGVDYNSIEGYTSSNGEVFDLRDSLDFRRTITGSGSDSGSIASPQSTIQADIEYYLPRFVALYIDADGVFDASVGVSAVSADKAQVPENSMLIADLYVPSWTPTTDSVVTFPVDNTRFTMRDIGKIERRVVNVESTVSLNLLETSAANLQVVDPDTGANRFKNGIFADPFLDFRLIDTDQSEASIDDANGGRLRPQVETIGVNLVHNTGGTVKDGMVSAPITTTVSFSSQSFATQSINVNPHAAFSWAGFIDLSPNRDFWVDTVYSAPKIINQTSNHRGSNREGIVYGKWARSSQGRFRFGVTQERGRTETVFTEWTTTRSAGDDILSTSLIPFMRAVDIEFTAKGLRPFTRVYPWFGGRAVPELCSPQGGALGDPLVTDAQGDLIGTLRVPRNSGFTTGEKSFILVDNANDPNDTLGRTTFSTASFSSSGTLVRRQRKTLRIRHLGVTQRKTIEYRRVDPIAQSFAVEQTGGIFCGGVDIYMRTKATTIPLTVEIREMENGIPTDEVIARTVLTPAQVNTSNDGSAATRVNFAPSVYLEGGEEYCIVLLANTQEYEAYIAEMGGTVIGSTQTVAKQPHTGVFFTSSNGSTWTPAQTQDMKFNLVRESYNTTPSYATFRATDTDTTKALKSNPLSSVAGSNVLTVDYPAHGCRVGDNITLTGVLPDAGLSSSVLNTSLSVSEVVDFDTLRVTLGETALTSVQFGGFEVFAAGGVLVNLVNINVDYTEFERAKPTFEFRYRLSSSRTISDWIQFTPGTDILLPEEGSYRSRDDIEVRALLNNNGILSPQIDTYGFTATLTSFRLDSNLEIFNYVTKPIALDNPSTSGRFFVGALLPSGSEMKVFIRFEGSDVWEEIPPQNAIVSSSSTFTETTYDLGERTAFASFRLRVGLKGSRVNPPVLRDIRGVVLA